VPSIYDNDDGRWRKSEWKRGGPALTINVVGLALPGRTIILTALRPEVVGFKTSFRRTVDYI